MQLLLIVFFLFHTIASMDNPVKDLVIPSVFKEHSCLLQELTKQGKTLNSLNEITIKQNDIYYIAQTYESSFDYNQLSIHELISLANYHNDLQMNFTPLGLKDALYKKIKDKKPKWEDFKKLNTPWQNFLMDLLGKDKKENRSLVASLKKFAYKWVMACKHFLYEYHKPLLSLIGAMIIIQILNIIYDHFNPIDISFNPDVFTRKHYGMFDIWIMEKIIYLTIFLQKRLQNI